MTVSALSIRFDAEKFWVDLSDGRTLGVPLSWFPRLCRATPEQRERVEIEQSGLHLPALDEDIILDGLLAGRRDRTRIGRAERQRLAEEMTENFGDLHALGLIDDAAYERALRDLDRESADD
jgi:hypothetical protein